MPRTARSIEARAIHHVLNRGQGRASNSPSVIRAFWCAERTLPLRSHFPVFCINDPAESGGKFRGDTGAPALVDQSYIQQIEKMNLVFESK